MKQRYQKLCSATLSQTIIDFYIEQCVPHFPVIQLEYSELCRVIYEALEETNSCLWATGKIYFFIQDQVLDTQEIKISEKPLGSL